MECELGGPCYISFSKTIAMLSFTLHAFFFNVSLELAYQEIESVPPSLLPLLNLAWPCDCYDQRKNLAEVRF